MVRAALSLAGASRPAASGASRWPLSGSLAGLSPCLEAAGGLPGLLDVFIAGALKEQASRNSPDGDRHLELGGEAQDAILHGVLACPRRHRDAGSGVVQRLDFLLEGVIELGVHAGPSAHTAGFVDWDIFKLEGR